MHICFTCLTHFICTHCKSGQNVNLGNLAIQPLIKDFLPLVILYCELIRFLSLLLLLSYSFPFSLFLFLLLFPAFLIHFYCQFARSNFSLSLSLSLSLSAFQL